MNTVKQALTNALIQKIFTHKDIKDRLQDVVGIVIEVTEEMRGDDDPAFADCLTPDVNNALVETLEELAVSIVANWDFALDDACPGCECKPGDGKTAGCSHPEGCGFSH